MLKVIAAASLMALFAVSPLAASAQTSGAPSAHSHNVHKPTGSHRSEMRKRHNASRERARASAEHKRKMHMQ